MARDGVGASEVATGLLRGETKIAEIEARRGAAFEPGFHARLERVLVQIFRETPADAITVRLLIPEILDAEIAVAGGVHLKVREVDQGATGHVVRVSGLPPGVGPD